MPKKISIDEIIAKRKDIGSDVAPIMKAAKAPASWNKESRSARFVMNAQAVDRYGDIIVTAGIDTTEFERNPVALLFHNSRTWPVGSWGNLEKVLKGRPPRIEGDIVLLPAGGPVKEIDETEWMIANGGIRACSIGFMPDWDNYEMILDDEERWTGGIQFNKSILLEASIVAIPASPQSLIKAAGRDMNLARELLEDVLDNWAKTPEGLLIPMDEYRAKHFDLNGNRSIFVIDKAFAPTAKTFVPVADMTLEATTQDEAVKFVGAKVTIDPDHAENKGAPFSDSLAKATGEVIDSWIVDEGVNKGVHALAVEFLTDAWSGMFRGIKADRFLLAEKAIADGTATVDEARDALGLDPLPVADVTDEKKGMDLLTDEVLDAFAAQIKEADIVVLRNADEVKLVIEREGESVGELVLPLDLTIRQIDEVSQSICDRVTKAKEEPESEKKPTSVGSISIELDTAEATEKLTALQRLLESVGATMAKFFGTKDVEKDDPD
ncbi:hypothetical protein EN883_03520, partial [Mesorhizobium sp. M7A.F.Ca.AU.002.06.1.1]